MRQPIDSKPASSSISPEPRSVYRVSALGPDRETTRRLVATAVWCAGAWIGCAQPPAAAWIDSGLLSFGCVAIGLGAWFTVSTSRSVAYVGAALGLLALFGFASGAIAAIPPTLLKLEDLEPGLAGPWRVQGHVARAPEPTPEGSLLEVRITAVRTGAAWRPWGGRVQLRVRELAAPRWHRGRRFEAFLSLRVDRPAANPGSRVHNAIRTPFAARATLKSYRQLRDRDATKRRPALEPGRLRTSIRRTLRDCLPRHHAVARALILGERSDLSGRLQNEMAGAGLIHLLALSGLHAGLFMAVVMGLLRAGGATPRVALAVSFAALALAMAIVVPRAPILRAGAMAASVTLARLLGRRVAPLDAYAVAVLALVVIDPAVTRDGGFQMSAVATAAILLVGVSPASRRRWPGAAFRASLAAQAATAPLVVARAHEIPIAAIGLNLVAIPLVALLLPLLLALLVTSAAGLAEVAAGLGGVADGLIGLLVRTSSAAASQPGLRVAVPGTELSVAIVYWAGLGLLGCRRSASGRGGTVTGAGLLLVGSATWMALQPPPVPSEPQLFVLDVGQGDALLLRHAERAVLIDAGGFPGIDFDPGARIVAPVLHHLGVKRLSAVAVTHPHVDHAGGIVAILERFPVDEVWLGAAPPDDRVLRRVLAAAAARGIATMTPIAGRRLVGCDWENSMPNDATLRAAAKRVGNEASLVLAVTCGLRRLLLTGDAGEPSERNWPLHRLRQGLLKVGHHGSDSSTSSWLLERLRPRHAVISVGARNVYGLPRHAVLQRLRQRGIAIYRTDRDGALSFRLGTRLRVHGQRWRSGRG